MQESPGEGAIKEISQPSKAAKMEKGATRSGTRRGTLEIKQTTQSRLSHHPTSEVFLLREARHDDDDDDDDDDKQRHPPARTHTRDTHTIATTDKSTGVVVPFSLPPSWDRCSVPVGYLTSTISRGVCVLMVAVPAVMDGK